MSTVSGNLLKELDSKVVGVGILGELLVPDGVMPNELANSSLVENWRFGDSSIVRCRSSEFYGPISLSGFREEVSFFISLLSSSRAAESVILRYIAADFMLSKSARLYRAVDPCRHREFVAHFEMFAEQCARILVGRSWLKSGLEGFVSALPQDTVSTQTYQRELDNLVQILIFIESRKNYLNSNIVSPLFGASSIAPLISACLGGEFAFVSYSLYDSDRPSSSLFTDSRFGDFIVVDDNVGTGNTVEFLSASARTKQSTSVETNWSRFFRAKSTGEAAFTLSTYSPSFFWYKDFRDVPRLVELSVSLAPEYPFFGDYVQECSTISSYLHEGSTFQFSLGAYIEEADSVAKEYPNLCSRNPLSRMYADYYFPKTLPTYAS